MEVREFLTPQPYRLQIDDSVQHAAQEMKQHNIGVLPVCSGDTLAGVITDRDIVTGCVAAGTQPDSPLSRAR
jgi:CBS domain-containing protein